MVKLKPSGTRRHTVTRTLTVRILTSINMKVYTVRVVVIEESDRQPIESFAKGSSDEAVSVDVALLSPPLLTSEEYLKAVLEAGVATGAYLRGK